MGSSDTASPFSVVMRGFDREQVLEHFRRVDAELRVLAADRDAAAAHARELTDLLDDAQDEIDNLRRDVDRLSVPPTTAEGMSDRIARMLRLAADEASEIRAQAQAEAAELTSIAEQDAAERRTEVDALRSDMDDRRTEVDRQHETTLAAAKTEAARIISAAEAQAALFDAKSKANRERVQEDFDTTMAARRAKAVADVQELEQTAAAEAADAVARAREYSQNTVNLANETAENAIEEANAAAEQQTAKAKALTEDLQQLRAAILAQLDDVRDHLSSIPDRLAAPENESTRVEQAVPAASYVRREAPAAVTTGDFEPAAVESASTESA